MLYLNNGILLKYENNFLAHAQGQLILKENYVRIKTSEHQKVTYKIKRQIK